MGHCYKYGTARYAHTATLLNSGKVLITGGSGSSGALASSEIYDSSTGQWNTTASMARARDTHAAILLNSGKVLINGGFGSHSELASSEIFDPSTGQWNYTASMITARGTPTATLLNSVPVTGGFQSSFASYGGSESVYILANSEIYDPSTGEWDSSASMATARYEYTATLLNSSKVLISGVYGSFGLLASSEPYDP
ncbi:unnamed protein product [Didymodactylos carnosus]|uniref:Uncharacterized protein n=1 Tax=Didymodactylos carnosus TaxID=1234261 RepID=A0A8S2EB45_9BILA|nr:unnamed protein product [Didymodactylos carnosus]CAF3863398.1 unnamed protein product [Didymodactylos carnosus]